MSVQDEWFAHVAGCHRCELRGLCEVGLAIVKRIHHIAEGEARKILPDPPEATAAEKS